MPLPGEPGLSKRRKKRRKERRDAG